MSYSTLGGIPPKHLRLGDKEIASIYLGTSKVYDAVNPIEIITNLPNSIVGDPLNPTGVMVGNNPVTLTFIADGTTGLMPKDTNEVEVKNCRYTWDRIDPTTGSITLNNPLGPVEISITANTDTCASPSATIANNIITIHPVETIEEYDISYKTSSSASSTSYTVLTTVLATNTDIEVDLEQLQGWSSVWAGNIPIRVTAKRYDYLPNSIQLTARKEISYSISYSGLTGIQVVNPPENNIVYGPVSTYTLGLLVTNPSTLELPYSSTGVTAANCTAVYSKESGTIKLSNISGNVTLTGSAVTLRDYEISCNTPESTSNLKIYENGSLISIPYSKTGIKNSDSITYTIYANTGYLVPETISLSNCSKVYTMAQDLLSATLILSKFTGNVELNFSAEHTALYSITTTLSGGLTIDSGYNPQVIRGNKSATVKFNGENPSSNSNGRGIELPANVVVTNANYQYGISGYTGTVVISNPTGNVTILATGRAFYQIATKTFTGVTLTPAFPNKIYTNETPLEYTVTANTGYELPDTVSYTGMSVSWQKDQSKLTVNSVNGLNPLKIKVLGVTNHSITVNTTGATLIGQTSPVTARTFDTAYLNFSPEPGYVLPSDLSSPSSIGVYWQPLKWSTGINLPSSYPASWSKANGRLTLNDIAQDLTVSVKGWKILNLRDDINSYIDNSSQNPQTVVLYTPSTLSYSIASGESYIFGTKPSSVHLGGASLSLYSYSPSEKPTSISFNITPYGNDLVTVDIDIFRVYSMAYNLTNISAGTGSPVEIIQGNTATIRLNAASGYAVPTSLTVSNCTSSWTISSDGSYGTLSISNVTGNLTITAVGTAKYSISLLSVNVISDPTNRTFIRAGETITLNYSTTSKYLLPLTIATIANVGSLTWTVDQTGRNGTLEIGNATGNVNISIITITLCNIIPVLTHTIADVNNPTIIRSDEQKDLYFTVENGYTLPPTLDSSNVTNANFVWSITNGVGKLTLSNAVDDVTISIESSIYYSITLIDTGFLGQFTTSPPSQIKSGTSFNFAYTGADTFFTIKDSHNNNVPYSYNSLTDLYEVGPCNDNITFTIWTESIEVQASLESGVLTITDVNENATSYDIKSDNTVIGTINA